MTARTVSAIVCTGILAFDASGFLTWCYLRIFHGVLFK